VRPGSGEVIVGGNDGLIRVWDPQRREVVRTFRGKHNGGVSKLLMNPDDLSLVISHNTQDRQLKVWDPATGNLMDEAVVPSRAAVLALSPNGKTLAVAHEDRLMLWDVRPLQLRKVLSMNKVSCIGFSPDGSKIAVGSSVYPTDKHSAPVLVWNSRIPGDDLLLSLLKANRGDLSKAILGMHGGGSSNVNFSYKRLTALTIEPRFRITDLGVRELMALTNLRELNLSGQPITDAALEYIGKLPELRKLWLANTEVTNAAGPLLGAMGQLETLGLNDTQVGDEIIADLELLKSLTELDLSRTRLTDLGLEGMGAFQSLRKLNIEKTKTSAAAVEKLRQALPQCEIKR
jgi:WD40 repeat protein